MTGRPPDDRFTDPTHKVTGGQQDGHTPKLASPEAYQTLSDLDQTLADVDQRGSDSDQAASDRDQTAADQDQAASDRDLVHGSDIGVHELTRGIRDRSAEERRHTAAGRLAPANARDEVAHRRDLIALARDQAAAVRDRELAARDLAETGRDTREASRAEIVRRAGERRREAATERAAAAGARDRAAADRTRAGRDRAAAGHDRLVAESEYAALLNLHSVAETDTVTGARTRQAGLADLDHEIDRARRTTARRLVVADVDVVGLPTTNGDANALLRRTAGTIRRNLRSYDLMVRLSRERFLCVMSGATIENARQHFSAIQAVLATEPEACPIDVGFAGLAADDTAASLIARAATKLPAGHAHPPIYASDFDEESD